MVDTDRDILTEIYTKGRNVHMEITYGDILNTL